MQPVRKPTPITPTDHLSLSALEIASRAGKLYEAAGDLADVMDHIARTQSPSELEGVLREMAERSSQDAARAAKRAKKLAKKHENDDDVITGARDPAVPPPGLVEVQPVTPDDLDPDRVVRALGGLLNAVDELRDYCTELGMLSVASERVPRGPNLPSPMQDLERTAPRLAEQFKNMMSAAKARAGEDEA